MTATPVLHIKRGFGIYVINSSKTIRSSEAPGCSHNSMQGNLRPKSTPNCVAPCCRPPPSMLCEDELLRSQPYVGWQSPGGTGEVGHLRASPGRCTHLWAHPFWFDAGHMEGGGSYSNPSPRCPWPRENKAAYPEVSSEKQSQVFPLISIQTSKGTFFFSLCFMKCCIHLLSAINKK